MGRLEVTSASDPGLGFSQRLPAGMRKCAQPEEAEKEHQGGHGLGMAPSASSYACFASTDDHKMEM